MTANGTTTGSRISTSSRRKMAATKKAPGVGNKRGVHVLHGRSSSTSMTMMSPDEGFLDAAREAASI